VAAQGGLQGSRATPAAERGAAIQRACGRDPQRRAQLLSWLTASLKKSAHAPADLASACACARPAASPPRRIGSARAPAARGARARQGRRRPRPQPRSTCCAARRAASAARRSHPPCRPAPQPRAPMRRPWGSPGPTLPAAPRAAACARAGSLRTGARAAPARADSLATVPSGCSPSAHARSLARRERRAQDEGPPLSESRPKRSACSTPGLTARPRHGRLPAKLRGAVQAQVTRSSAQVRLQMRRRAADERASRESAQRDTRSTHGPAQRPPQPGPVQLLVPALLGAAGSSSARCGAESVHTPPALPCGPDAAEAARFSGSAKSLVGHL